MKKEPVEKGKHYWKLRPRLLHLFQQACPSLWDHLRAIAKSERWSRERWTSASGPNTFLPTFSLRRASVQRALKRTPGPSTLFFFSLFVVFPGVPSSDFQIEVSLITTFLIVSFTTPAGFFFLLKKEKKKFSWGICLRGVSSPRGHGASTNFFFFSLFTSFYLKVFSRVSPVHTHTTSLCFD